MSLRSGRNTVERGEEAGGRGRNTGGSEAEEGINGRDGEAEDDGLWRRTKESVGATEKARVL